jgi:rhomboid protease GluP
MRFFVPTRARWATRLLVDASLAIFLLMTLTGSHPVEPSIADLLRWGGQRDGQWWRYVTELFVHSGIIHLVINMVFLAFGGLMLETLLEGRQAFVLAIYLAGGVAGGLATPTTGAVSVGASAAVFAVLGALVGGQVRPDVRIATGRLPLFIVLPIVALDLLFGRRTGFGWQAHIAGFVTGVVVGPFLPYRLGRVDDTGLDEEPQ